MSRRIGYVARGVLAGVGLLAVIVGSPILLVKLGSNPLAVLHVDWPSPEQIHDWLFTPDYGLYRFSAMFIVVIQVIYWGSWAWFTILTVYEVVLQLRDLRRGLLETQPDGLVRGAVAGLITAMLLLGSHTTPGAGSAAPMAATSQLAPPPPPQSIGIATWTGHHSGQQQQPSPTSDGLPRYSTHIGDSLWGLAERFLGGDGLRWKEIHQLNRYTLPANPHLLDVGVVLRLPPDAALPPPPADPGPGAHRITVKPRDTLSGIAARELGDADAATRLFDINQGRTQPDGRALTDPDFLMTGWKLWIPAQVSPPVQPPPHEAVPAPPAAPAVPPVVPPGAPTTSGGSPQPAGSGGNGQDSESTPGTSTHPSPPAPLPAQPPVTVRPAPQGGEPGLQLGPGAIVSAGLAAAVAAALVAARVRHRRRARSAGRGGEQYEPPPVVGELHRAQHRQLAAAADALDDVEPPSPDSDPPTIPIGPPLPAWPPWGSRTDHRGHSDAVTWPTLPLAPAVAFGHTAAGELVLDLEQCRGLGLTGPGALPAARAVVASLLAAAGPGQSLDHTYLISPRVDAQRLLQDQQVAVGRPRWRTVDSLDLAIKELELELLRRLRLLRDTEAADRDEIRAQHPSETFTEFVLLATPTPQAAPRIQAVLDQGAALGLSAVLLGDWPPGLTCHINEHGVAQHARAPRAPHQAAAVTGHQLYRLPAPSAAQLVELFAPTEADPADEPHHGAPEPSTATSITAAHNGAATDENGSLPAENGSAPAEIRSTPAQAQPLQPLPLAASVSAELAGSAELPAGYSLGLFGLGGLRVVIRSVGEPETDNGDESKSAPVRDGTAEFTKMQLILLSCLMLWPKGTPTAELLECGWSGVPTAKANARLASAMTDIRNRARQLTGHPDPVVAYDGRLHQLAKHVWVDWWEFRSAVTTARKASDSAARLPALQRIAELYQGPLLDNLTADGVAAAALNAQTAAVDALVELAGVLTDDEPHRAVGLLYAALEHDPLNDDTTQALMLVLHELGRNQQARQVYDTLAELLADHGHEPDSRTTELLAAIDKTRHRPPGRTNHPHTAPAQRQRPAE